MNARFSAVSNKKKQYVHDHEPIYLFISYKFYSCVAYRMTLE